MSDLMLFGVLEMPYKMAMSDEISRTQFHSRAKQACDRIRALVAELAALKGQQPVDAVLLDDMVEGQHPDYGRGLFATDNCVKPLYLAAGAQPVQSLEQIVKDSILYGTGVSLGGRRIHPKEFLAQEQRKEQQ